MAKYEGWKIRSGFLSGNLFADGGDDLGTYDEDESARSYARMCQEALETAFPGAKVEVPYELRASGATPIPLQTLVTDPDGVDYLPGDYGKGGRIADRVEEVCGQVWESWEWVVYEDDRELRWQVLEDNAGGLHLAVFEGGRVIFYGHGYEHNEEGLRADLEALRNGADPRTDAWEMPVDDPQAAYDELTSYEYGWAVVADDEGVYYDRMGAAAQRVFGTGE